MLTCAHHWLCGETVAFRTPAVCKKCGEAREFVNEVSDWNLSSSNPEFNKIRRDDYRLAEERFVA